MNNHQFTVIETSLSGENGVQGPLFFNIIIVSRIFLTWSRGGSRIPCRRGRQPSRGGRQHTIFVKFSEKLHEIEKILGRRGGGALRVRPPLNPPLWSVIYWS